jgi:hypothetical protein
LISTPALRAGREPGAGARPALVWAALAAATAAKLYLALKTAGTLDAAAYADYAAKLRALGGIGLYHDPGAYHNPFVYLPLAAHALRLIHRLADVTPLPFAFWLRLPCILADAGGLLVVWRYFARGGDAAGRPADPAAVSFYPTPWSLNPAPKNFNLTPGQFGSLLVLALSPVSLLISGYHGNTDPLMIFLALVSLSLAEGRGARSRRESFSASRSALRPCRSSSPPPSGSTSARRSPGCVSSARPRLASC